MRDLPKWAWMGISLGAVNRAYWHRYGRLLALRSQCAILTGVNYDSAAASVTNELAKHRREFEAWRLANGHGPIPPTKTELAMQELMKEPHDG